MLQKTLIIFSIIFLLFTSCSKSKNAPYAKIVSPANNAIFHSGDTINFHCEGKTSDAFMEFDELRFSLRIQNTGKILLNEEINGIIQYVPNFTDTTELLASAEYWKEDGKKASKQHQIIITVLP